MGVYTVRQMHPSCEVTQHNNGTATVAIACKLPHGIVMEVGKPGEMEGRDKYGWARIRGARASANQLGRRTVDGVAAVTIVPKAFAERWFKEHSFMEAVREGLIKMFDSPEAATAHAYSTGAQRHGFEPLPGPSGQVEADEEHLNRLKSA